ncbi:hypothetical protein [Sphingobacterium deserti]|uniref:DUF4374 domain-containing protein n=1 Tax=Sphingobacterium deserti TaxID=1229276 RepID=A0A0B8T054_9SPHI|nr:hypothetical protein [Sphingobacterium deserti]KGE13762.1 hypothetical protein DI53_2456 [Sphingobacterium deserti]
MKKTRFFSLLALLAFSASLGACSNDDDPTPPIDGDGTSKYVLMTVSDRTQQNGGGYISAFDAIPTGSISNVVGGKSLTANRGAAGWRTYGNWIFKMYRSADGVQGIEKLAVSADGTVSSSAFITSKNPTEAAKRTGTGNFVIHNETTGFYWDAAEPLKIQQFNPTTMANTGVLDFANEVNQNELAVRNTSSETIQFRAIGQKFLAIKNGKLYANIGYGKLATTQAGFFDDVFPSVYIAVIDVATGTYEKTIRIADAGSIAYINDNRMYDFDSNGDLYIVTQGKHPQGLGGKSKIVRIKANETDIDPMWELKFSDYRAADDGKFVNVFADNGRLILTLNSIALTGGPSGNINSADIWKFYSVDVSTKTFAEISGIPTGNNPGAAFAVTEVDGKILLRGSSSETNSANGYYTYNASNNSATKLFDVSEGGAVAGFVKVLVD